MSRSIKKTPVTGHTNSPSEKFDKQRANRIFRRISKELIHRSEYCKLPIKIREIVDTWTMSKDGKSYKKYILAEYMRK